LAHCHDLAVLRDAEVRYAQHEDAHLAYSVFGEGPPLLWAPSQFVPIAAMHEEPAYERFLDDLAGFATVIVFDRRGVGLSDPLPGEPTVDDWAMQLESVMDAAGHESCYVVAHAWGGLAGVTLAVTRPARVRGLVLAVAAVKLGRSDDASVEDVVASARPSAPASGVDFLAILAPSRYEDAAFRRWWDSAGRRGASPAVAQRLLTLHGTSDVTHLLPAVEVPTLVIHRPGVQLMSGAPFGAEIDGARVVEVPGIDTLLWASDGDAVAAEIEDFVTGSRRAAPARRRLLTVMFTDVVGSTTAAAELGDDRWRDVLETHDRLLRAEILRHQGTEVSTAGDGFLVTFESPSDAVRCGQRLHRVLREIGIRLRVGIHCGEVELRERSIAGIAVHLAARVQTAATPGETWVTSTVRDAMTGSPAGFDDRGTHRLKGVPHAWQLYAVAPPG
jgi:class 3 adenylate cyclase